MEMIFFYRISELMLATLIQRYDKKQKKKKKKQKQKKKKKNNFKNEKLTDSLQAIRCHIL